MEVREPKKAGLPFSTIGRCVRRALTQMGMTQGRESPVDNTFDGSQFGFPYEEQEGGNAMMYLQAIYLDLMYYHIRDILLARYACRDNFYVRQRTSHRYLRCLTRKGHVTCLCLDDVRRWDVRTASRV